MNRAIDASYGEVTGITQTIRNYGSTMGIAVLGTALTTVFTSKLTKSLDALGLPRRAVQAIAQGSTEAGGAAQSRTVPVTLRAHVEAAAAQAFASATQAVLYGMAIALGITFLVAIRHPGGLPKVDSTDYDAPQSRQSA